MSETVKRAFDPMNETPNYQLPLYQANSSVNLLQNFNDLSTKVDTALKDNADEGSANMTAVSTLQSQMTTANQNIATNTSDITTLKETTASHTNSINNINEDLVAQNKLVKQNTTGIASLNEDLVAQNNLVNQNTTNIANLSRNKNFIPIIVEGALPPHQIASILIEDVKMRCVGRLVFYGESFTAINNDFAVLQTNPIVIPIYTKAISNGSVVYTSAPLTVRITTPEAHKVQIEVENTSERAVSISCIGVQLYRA